MTASRRSVVLNYFWTGLRILFTTFFEKNSSREINVSLFGVLHWQQWQPHASSPAHYDVTKLNEQDQFDLVDMPHNFFEGNTYKYLLFSVDVASRYRVPKPLTTKKSSEVAFVLGAICKKSGTFKYPKVFQCDSDSEFKGQVIKLLEKHNLDIRRATAKYKHTHTAVVEASNKDLEKLLFKPMDVQELQNPKKVPTIWVKNVDPAVKRLNNIISSMIGMKPIDAIKVDTVPLDKKPYYLRMVYTDIFINLVNSMETKENEQQTLFGVKIRID